MLHALIPFWQRLCLLKSANVTQVSIILSWFLASLYIFVKYLSKYLFFQHEIVIQFCECNLFSNYFCPFWFKIIIITITPPPTTIILIIIIVIKIACYWSADKRIVMWNNPMYPLNMEQGNEGNHPFFVPAPAYKSQIIICTVKHLAVLCFALSVHKIQVNFLWFLQSYNLLGLTEVHPADTAYSLYPARSWSTPLWSLKSVIAFAGSSPLVWGFSPSWVCAGFT